MQSKFCTVDSCKFGNPTDHLHWQNCHTSKNLHHHLFIKECQQKLDPDLNPWLPLRSEQLSSGAGQPVLMCLLCSPKSWEPVQGCCLGTAGEGWRDAQVPREGCVGYTECLAAHSPVGTRWWCAAQPPHRPVGSSAGTPESLHQEHSTKRKHQDLDHWFETEIVIKNCFDFK